MKILVLLWLATATVFAAPLRVGLVLDKGGRDDKSFNAAAFKGATEAKEKLKIHLKVVEAGDDTVIEAALRTFAHHGFDLILGIGFVQASAIRKVALDYPKTSFVVVDSEVNLPNVQSVFFTEHEGSFLVGAIAALTSKSHVVGFVGGMAIPLIRRFEMGFRAGAEAALPTTKVLSNYVGSASDAWKNPTRAKELALSQYQKKADIIFCAAGASGTGVFDAAEEQVKFAIGVDSNQNWVKPGRILTSMIKRVDLAVYDAIAAKQKGELKSGKVVLGLAKGGVDYAIDDFNRSLITPQTLARVEQFKAQIIAGKIKVPDFYELPATAKKQ